MAPKFKSKFENRTETRPDGNASEFENRTWLTGCRNTKMGDRKQAEAGVSREKICIDTSKNKCEACRIGGENFRTVDTIFLLLRICGGEIGRFLVSAAILLTMFNGCCAYEEQRFAMEPQDQTAIINSRVTLPCRVLGKSGQLQWTKDDFGLGTHRNLSGYDRYAMIGSDEEGDYSLDIRSLTLDDDAKYQCQVSSGPQGQPGIRSRYARLTVLVPPEQPRITQGDFLASTEDRELELECVSVGGKPPAEITWVDGKRNVLSQRISNTVEALADGKRFTVRSILRLTPKREHHNQTFTCQAQNTADRTYKAANITLEVKYAPKVSVKVVQGAGPGNSIHEFREVRIACNADANPADLAYKWYLNDEPVIGDFTTEMVIFNITRAYHDAIVKCEVYNSVGKSEESETLQISYGPKFRSRPQSVEAAEGSSVTLACDVDGNPPPKITWRHQEQDVEPMKVGTTPNLTITVTESSAGRYTCRAEVPNFPYIEADAMLYVQGLPRITSHRTQFGAQGDNVRVECTAFSVPKPERVLWTFNGHEINALHDQDYAFLEDQLPEGVKSTLIIRESQSRHFGPYNCTVVNEYGRDTAEILLKPQKSFPLLLILFGVTGGIIVIVAFVMLVILCQRKRRRREQSSGAGKKPDVMADLGNATVGHCKESDRSSNISDLKLELRQADGGCELDYSSQDYSCTGSDAALHRSNLQLASGLGLGLPLAGPVSLPAGGNLVMYTRYSNDYSDPAYSEPHYKDGHNNNGYVTYVDYSRDYTPPTLHLQSPPSAIDAHTANRIQLSSLHSNSQLNQLNALNSNNGSLNGSLTRSIDTTSTVQYNSGSASQNNSLNRQIANTKHRDSNNALNSLGLPMIVSDGAPSPLYSHHNGLGKGPLLANGGVLANGVDVRYAATYGNPYLRSGGGLGSVSQVNTAKPAATPAPPPYSAVRNSLVGMASLTPGVSLTSPTSVTSSQYATSPGVSTAVTAVGNAQPQVARSQSMLAPQSPGSQYILPPAGHAAAQLVQLTKKGNGNQPSLATHV